MPGCNTVIRRVGSHKMCQFSAIGMRGCLVVMLMAMAVAPTTLPHIVEATCGVDARSPEFLDRFAGQVAVPARHLRLG